ncbi:hypothetical protein HMI55_001131 [Coelomomyces lativittatus]|nr:hypothetical protein HMI55_001131 [Coelomomyces lativittatus]
MEAGKLVARFLPGVGIFMLGVDRLTRWKLIYSKNEPLVAHLERKMTDLTTIYIALAELLHPNLNKKNHPQFELFSKKAHQIKEIIDTIQILIKDFHEKNEGQKLGLAEIIHSNFLSLQQVLDDLQRDVILNLSIHNIHHIHLQNSTLDHILTILTEQKAHLETQEKKLNKDLLLLLERQIRSHEYMDLCLKQLNDDHTPGYAKVSHLEIRKLWFDFFRWPAIISSSKFIDEMPLYFEMNKDEEALKIWVRLQNNENKKSSTALSFKDIGFSIASSENITAFALNKIFPFDPMYEVKIGDWIVWSSLGWLFLVYEIHKQFAGLNGKGFFLFPTLISKYLSFISHLVSNACTLYDYDTTLHERLKKISIYIRECTSFTPFAERFNMLIIGLQEAFLKIESHYQTHRWPDDQETQAVLQQWITSQRQLSDLSTLLELEVRPWTEKEIESMMHAELKATERAHTLGISLANKVCHYWNGQFLIPTNLFSSPVQKLGSHTWKTHFLNSPVILKSLECDPEPVETMLKKTAFFLTLHLCPYLLQIYGITFFQGQCFLVMEYSHHGALLSYLRNISATPPKNDASDFNLALKLDFCCQIISALLFLHHRNVSIGDLFSLNNVFYMSDGVCKLECTDLVVEENHADELSVNSNTKLNLFFPRPVPLDFKKKISHLVIEILTETPLTSSELNPPLDLTEKEWTQKLQQWPKDLLQFIFNLSTKPELVETISLHQLLNFLKSCKPKHSSLMKSFVEVPNDESTKLKDLTSALFDTATPISAIEKELLTISKTNPLACFYLGDLFYYDFKTRGGTQNFERAKKWYREAVAKKVGWGHIGLADFAYFGLASDIAKDLWVAELGYSSGLNQFFPEVHPSTLSRMYAGLGDVNYDSKNFVMALDYYQQAIQYNADCSRALARLGNMYLNGLGVTVDFSEAERCYRKAINSRRGVEGMLMLFKLKNTKINTTEFNLQLLKHQDF